MKTSIKKIHQTSKSLNKPLLMNASISGFYPVIIDSDGEESPVNFIDDYLTVHSYYDDFAKFQFGNRVYDCDEDSYTTVYNEWIEECNSIVMVHLESWAYIYYTLWLTRKTNPLWNVDGTEKEIYSDVETENEFGVDKTTSAYAKDKVTNSYGADTSSITNGAQTNGSTTYAVSYDTSTEHESNRVADSIGARTDSTTRNAHTDTIETDAKSDSITRDARTDSSTVKEHTITKIRGGNIGVTSMQNLVEQTYEMAKKDFWRTVIETIIRETGADYDE